MPCLPVMQPPAPLRGAWGRSGRCSERGANRLLWRGEMIAKVVKVAGDIVIRRRSRRLRLGGWASSTSGRQAVRPIRSPIDFGPITVRLMTARLAPT